MYLDNRLYNHLIDLALLFQFRQLKSKHVFPTVKKMYQLSYSSLNSPFSEIFVAIG